MFHFSEKLLREKLIPVYALKIRQNLGKKCGKRLNSEVVERLKEMFIRGNIDKNVKLSAEDMLKNIQILVNNNEIENENIPKIEQIRSWFGRFNQQYKKESAKQAIISSSSMQLE